MIYRSPVALLVQALWVGLVLCTSPSAAPADEAPTVAAAPLLAVGDEAPAIDVAHWVHGVATDARGNFEPIADWKPGQVYVLEFWATWCGPCLRGMPHLSDLQRAHDGVQILGVSDETLPKVVSFLLEKDRVDGLPHHERIAYTLGCDPDRSTREAWFDAAGQRGIPCAFLIGKSGHIEWIGHPMQLDVPLAAVVAGTWDREAARVAYEAEQAKTAVRQAFLNRYSPALRGGDFAAALELLDAEGEALGERRAMERAQLLFRLGRTEEAAAAVEGMLADNGEDASLRNALAWFLVDTKGLVDPPLDLALRLAKEAAALTREEDAAILDTLARVHLERGDLAAALAWQTRAVARAGEGRMADAMKQTLAEYAKRALGEE